MTDRTEVRDSIGRKLRDHARDPEKYAGGAAVQTEDTPAAQPTGQEQPAAGAGKEEIQ